MSRIYSLMLAGFGVLLGSATSAESPVRPPQAPILVTRPPITLSGEQQSFRFIAHELHLDDSREAIQSLRAESSVDHLHDYLGEVILVVKPELLGASGESRIRAADGTYPFFVFRQSEHGWFLLGRMDGKGYEWSTQSRHLVFQMSAEQPGGARTVVRYEVNPSALVNLSLLARQEQEFHPAAPDLHKAF